MLPGLITQTMHDQICQIALLDLVKVFMAVLSYCYNSSYLFAAWCIWVFFCTFVLQDLWNSIKLKRVWKCEKFMLSQTKLIKTLKLSQKSKLDIKLFKLTIRLISYRCCHFWHPFCTTICYYFTIMSFDKVT